jgi:putative ABC transport system permease protein
MWRIAWNNLRHDRIRLVVSIVGVSVAIALICIQGGMFLGAVETGARLPRRSDADLWVVPEKTVTGEFSVTMPERKMYQALSVAGVESAGRLLVGQAIWRFPDGRQEPVFVIGVETDHDWFGVARAFDPAILRDRAALFDERETVRLSVAGRPLQLGDTAEINGYQAQVAGFVPNLNAFAVTPYVVCRHETARNYLGIADDQTTFVMIKCKPGADISQVKADLQRRLTDVEVLTRDEFADRCWRYWVMNTGMGMALILSAVLAFIVGSAVVGQTTLSSVLTKVREFATLKALGFGNGFIFGIVVLQTVIVALIGYAIGIAATALVAKWAADFGNAVVIRTPPLLIWGMGPVAVLMSLMAGLAAAARAMLVPPAKVFR